jgi:hypothetical protein
MPIFNNILAGSSGQSTGYDIERSVVLDTNSYFTRTPSSSSNRKTWTWSSWVKISEAGAVGQQDVLFECYEDNENRCGFFVGDSATNYIGFFGETSNTHQVNLATTAAYRDYSGWYHLMVVLDTTQSTASNRAKIYINGEQVTDFSTATYPNQNDDLTINKNIEHMMGVGKWGGAISSTYYHGYMAETHFIDGTALTPASFGETNSDTNQWIAKKYAGSYGTNGFYLDFATRATDPIDASGNGNDWGSTNVIAGDWKIDSPTNNFATLNPLVKSTNTFSEGNLKVTASTSAGSKWASTIGVSSGKWYAEFITPASNFVIGITADNTERDYLGNSDGNTSIAWWPVTSATNLFINGSNTAWAGNTTTWANGDIVGLALNADDEEISIYKNGTLISPAVSYSSYNWTQAFFAGGNYASGLVYYTNFGQDSSFAGQKTAQGNGGVGEDFYYTPPTGYKALNTNNLDNPAIALPNEHFETVLYTGNGSTQSITGVGFQPDLLWVKSRNAAYNHVLNDVIRGVGYNIESNLNSSESYASNRLGSFDSDGFSLVGNAQSFNESGKTYVGWNWKADNTSGSSNTDGTITSTVSANTTAGFSIVSYTGNGSTNQTVGHGLSQKPDLVIYKDRDSGNAWRVIPVFNNDGYYLSLSGVASQVTTSTSYFGTNTSSVLGITGSNSGIINTSGNDIIAYCFHSVEGYSKVGSYTGNGSTDGAFLYTGFMPEWLLVKQVNAAGNWLIWDVKRSEFNVMNDYLVPNESSEERENTAVNVDFVSNGFKWRNSDDDMNGSGDTYIYLAFAESPFKYSNAR